MCGLAIAILALVPFNYFTRKLAQLEFELQSAATNVDVMVIAAKQKGFDTMEFRRETSKA
jgi:biopolymer transport protein ExbB